MHIYYVAGLPYSDDLYHSGVKGMKWGRRLYQYEDGSLTPLGRIHYGVKNTAKKVGTHIIDKFKDNHKWLMSDEELDKRIARATKEKQYKDLLVANKKTVSRGKRVAGEILESGAKTIVKGLFDKAYNNIVNGPDKNSPSFKFVQEFTENFDIESKPNYDDIKNAADYADALRRLEGKGGGGNNGGGGKKKKGGG